MRRRLSTFDRALSTSSSFLPPPPPPITAATATATTTTTKKKHQQAFANERLSPEVLPYEHELVSRVREALTRHEAAALDLERRHGDAAKPSTVACEAAASRCKYLLAVYHRARLHKVEACAAALLDTPGALEGGRDGASAALLSPAEAAHARDYFLVAGRHLKQAAARRLPPQFDSLVRQSAASSGRDMVSGPNLDVHVVVRALADKGEMRVFPLPFFQFLREREGGKRPEEKKPTFSVFKNKTNQRNISKKQERSRSTLTARARSSSARGTRTRCGTRLRGSSWRTSGWRLCKTIFEK